MAKSLSEVDINKIFDRLVNIHDFKLDELLSRSDCIDVDVLRASTERITTKKIKNILINELKGE